MERQPTVLDATVPAGRRSAPASTGRIVQRALLVGRADDPSEREADRIADVVVGSLDTTGATRTSAGVSRIRRSAQTDRLGGSSADADTDPAIRSQTGVGAALPTRIARRVGSPIGADLGHVAQHGDTRIRRYHAPADPTKAWKKRENADNELFVDIHALRQWVNEGAVKDGDTDDDRRLRNSCNWILAGKAKLFAVVPTGDTDERVTHQGQDPKVQHVLFPRAQADNLAGDVMANARVGYNHADLDDNKNTYTTRKTVGGWNAPGFIAIVRPSKNGRKSAWATIRHEVQHDADMNQDKRTAINASADPAQLKADKVSLERYKTEYRAYNYQDQSYAKYSTTKTVNRFGHVWTERQLQIFLHIYSGYPYVKAAWDGNVAVAGGQNFQTAVVAYVDPDAEGHNKYNSPAVHDFYLSLKACADNTADYMDDAAFAVQLAARKLSAEDRAAVLAAPDTVKMIEAKLADLAYTMVMGILRPKKK